MMQPGDRCLRFLLLLAGAFFIISLITAVLALPWQCACLCLPAWIWVLLASAYVVALIGGYWWTGIAPYEGAKRYAAIADLLLLGILTYTSGGMASPVYALLVCQVIVFHRAHDHSLKSLLWYAPLLALAWGLPAYAWQPWWSKVTGVSPQGYAILTGCQYVGLIAITLLLLYWPQHQASEQSVRPSEAYSQALLTSSALCGHQYEQMRVRMRHWRRQARAAKVWRAFTQDFLALLAQDLHARPLNSPHHCAHLLPFLQVAAASLEPETQGSWPAMEPLDLSTLLPQAYQGAREAFSGPCPPLQLEFISPPEQPIEQADHALVLFLCREIMRAMLPHLHAQNPLRATICIRDELVHIKWIAALNIQTQCGPATGLSCPGCQAKLRCLYSLAPGEHFVCERCLRNVVEDMLRLCSQPGIQQAPSLYLFPVHYLLVRFYHGNLTCGVHCWDERTIYVGITFPDKPSLRHLHNQALS